MSEFRGHRCNSCSKIIEDPSERVKERVTFERADGTTDGFFRDLCGECAHGAEAETRAAYEPIPKRRRRTVRSGVPAA